MKKIGLIAAVILMTMAGYANIDDFPGAASTATAQTHSDITMTETNDSLVFNITDYFAPNGSYGTYITENLFDTLCPTKSRCLTPVPVVLENVTTNSSAKITSETKKIKKSTLQNYRPGFVCAASGAGCDSWIYDYYAITATIIDMKTKNPISAHLVINLDNYTLAKNAKWMDEGKYDPDLLSQFSVGTCDCCLQT